MKVAAAVLVLALSVPFVASDDVVHNGRGERAHRQDVEQEFVVMRDLAVDEDDEVNFWNRELGSKGSGKGKDISKGDSKSKGKGKGGSKGSHRLLEVNSEFMTEHSIDVEDIEFWNRELGSKGSGKGKGGSKGDSKSKGKGKGGSKGSRRLLDPQADVASGQIIDEDEALDFWNRELGSKGSGKGKGGSKGDSKSKGKGRGKGGSKGSHRLLQEEDDTVNEQYIDEDEAIDFWNRELGSKGSGKGKGGSKGGSKSKGKGGSKGSHRELEINSDINEEQVIDDEEAVDFWNRELGSKGSGKGKGGSKGGSKSKGSKGKGGSKGHRWL